MAEPDSRRGPRTVAVLAVIVVLLAVVATALVTSPATPDSRGGVDPGTVSDPAADYDAAVAAGVPIYVLVHSSG
jgi:hypothetical protein